MRHGIRPPTIPFCWRSTGPTDEPVAIGVAPARRHSKHNWPPRTTITRQVVRPGIAACIERRRRVAGTPSSSEYLAAAVAPALGSLRPIRRSSSSASSTRRRKQLSSHSAIRQPLNRARGDSRCASASASSSLRAPGSRYRGRDPCCPLSDQPQLLSRKRRPLPQLEDRSRDPVQPCWRRRCSRRGGAGSRAFRLRLRAPGGKKIPGAAAALRADDLMRGVFPIRSRCAEKSSATARFAITPLVPGPLIDCLHEAMDVEASSTSCAASRRARSKWSRSTCVAFAAQRLEILTVSASLCVISTTRRSKSDAPQAVMARRLARSGDRGGHGPGSTPLRSSAVREEAWPEARNATNCTMRCSGSGFLTRG